MDKLTIETYDEEAEKIAKLHENLIPEVLYQLIIKFFRPAGKTLDIGCGSGRDCAWLSENGFKVTGVDVSYGMLNQARKRHPEINFLHTALPDLCDISDGEFSNVLCSAVLMHLEHGLLALAVKNLVRVLAEGGILLVSVRGTEKENKRENGKLYVTITQEYMIELFELEGAKLLFYESDLETERNLLWHTYVFKK